MLTVSILKSALLVEDCDTEFLWHGYGNYNGVPVWINAAETGIDYHVPQFVATLANEITGVTLEAGELFDFVICYTFPICIAGDYTITTTVDVA